MLKFSLYVFHIFIPLRALFFFFFSFSTNFKILEFFRKQIVMFKSFPKQAQHHILFVVVIC